MKKNFAIVCFTFLTIQSIVSQRVWPVDVCFGIIAPIMYHNVEVEDIPDKVDTMGVGAILSLRTHNRNNFAINVNFAIAYGKSTIVGFRDDFNGLTLNGFFGFGYRINANRFTFVPSVEIGTHFVFLSNDLEYAKVGIFGCAMELGGDLYFSYLCTKKFGIFASLDITCNLFGMGSESVNANGKKASLDVYIKPGTVNLLPSIGFFIGGR